jgi:hypothetical protein
MQVAGVAYVANTFFFLLTPGVARILLLIPTVVAETALALWLVVRRVDVPRFRQVSLASGGFPDEVERLTTDDEKPAASLEPHASSRR